MVVLDRFMGEGIKIDVVQPSITSKDQNLDLLGVDDRATKKSMTKKRSKKLKKKGTTDVFKKIDFVNKVKEGIAKRFNDNMENAYLSLKTEFFKSGFTNVSDSQDSSHNQQQSSS